jgi:hypothetical protein
MLQKHGGQMSKEWTALYMDNDNFWKNRDKRNKKELGEGNLWDEQGKQRLEYRNNIYWWIYKMPITVVARSKAWTVSARSKARIMGQNPTQGMDICVCDYSLFMLFCV